jgi:hypothetical protein
MTKLGPWPEAFADGLAGKSLITEPVRSRWPYGRAQTAEDMAWPRSPAPAGCAQPSTTSAWACLWTNSAQYEVEHIADAAAAIFTSG